MNLSTESFIVLPIIANCVVLFIVSLLLYARAKRLKKIEKALKRKEEQMAIRAQKHAESIIRQAVAKARELMASSKKTEKELESQLEAAIEDAKRAYEKMLTIDLAETEEKLEREAVTQLTNLTQKTDSELMTYEKQITKKIDEDYAQLRNEIAAYKKERIAGIDAELKKQIDELAMRVFAHALTQKDHEELIQIAIAKAKKELFLS